MIGWHGEGPDAGRRCGGVAGVACGRKAGWVALLAIVVTFAVAPALAGQSCFIIGVADGDTLSAHCLERGLKVRVAEIDAPERNQAFGTRAWLRLAVLCFGRIAEIEVRETDRYGRAVANVTCGGKDAAAAMVRGGFAWRYDRYSRSGELARLQEQARRQQRGLWAHAAPVAPWEWRRAAARR